MTEVEAAQTWIATCLERIGNDPDLIEEKLNFFECAGVPGDPDASPIGIYLERRMRVRGPRVIRTSAGYRIETDGYGEPISLPVPRVVEIFLTLFDAGYYPYLTDPAAD